MKEKIKDHLKAIKGFLVEWNEFVTVPIALLLFWAGGALIRWIDPTSGLFDPGIYQIILFVVGAFLIFHGVAWLLLKLTFPEAFRFMSRTFEEEIKRADNDPLPQEQKLSKYQKCILIFLYLFGCLLSMVLLARVIM
ncbi:MAG: hypothetical protein JXM68_06190 [Sedimentisphaerales bacterium]|nr:hypothetical protein [Sedimentisphaerales bacterium]